MSDKDQKAPVSPPVSAVKDATEDGAEPMTDIDRAIESLERAERAECDIVGEFDRETQATEDRYRLEMQFHRERFGPLLKAARELKVIAEERVRTLRESCGHDARVFGTCIRCGHVLR